MGAGAVSIEEAGRNQSEACGRCSAVGNGPTTPRTARAWPQEWQRLPATTRCEEFDRYPVWDLLANRGRRRKILCRGWGGVPSEAASLGGACVELTWEAPVVVIFSEKMAVCSKELGNLLV